jgi:hypothetical protein
MHALERFFSYRSAAVVRDLSDTGRLNGDAWARSPDMAYTRYAGNCASGHRSVA